MKNRPINLSDTPTGKTIVFFEKGKPEFIKVGDREKWLQRIDETWAAKEAESSALPSLSAENENKNRKEKTMNKSENKESLQEKVTATSANLKLQARVELDYGEQDLGWILRGWVEKARGCGHDPHRMFKQEEPCNQLDKRSQKLLELGRELFESLPAATSFFGVDEEEWASWFKSAKPQSCISAEHAKDNAHNTQNKGQHRALPMHSSANDAWLAPVTGPISSRFGQRRASGIHEGIDVAVGVGTHVVAPVAMQVEKVGFSERSGRFVVANVMRPNGEFDDGDGYRLTFAHLSEVLVEEGGVVLRGQGFARSGATGSVTGPHLHFRVQWVEDGYLSDDVISIDPLSVVPEQVFAGQMPAQTLGARPSTALRNGQPINIIIAPGSGRVSAGGSGVTQPDVGIQLPLGLGQTEQSRFVQPQEEDGFNGVFDAAEDEDGDFLADFFEEVVEQAPGFIRAVGNVAQAAGSIAQVGGTLASFIPGAAPVALPIAAVGSAIGAVAQPVAQVGAGVAQVGGNVFQGNDPLKGFFTL